MTDLSNATTAIATLGTMVVAVFAAVASKRSAAAAERQLQHAEKIERLRLERELALSGQRTIAQSISVIDTGEELQSAYEALRVITRGHEGQCEHRVAVVEKRKQGALDLQGKAMALLDRRSTWKHNTDEELWQHLSTTEGFTVQLERSRLRLEGELRRYEGFITEERVRMKAIVDRVGV